MMKLKGEVGYSVDIGGEGERPDPPKESDPLLEKKQKNEEDIESSSSDVCCRFCREYDAKPAEDELISPCMCTGTHQFVHRSCLDHWRSFKMGFAFSHCTTCRAQFHFQLEGHSWRKVNFRFLVASNIIVVFLALQILIAIIGGLVYLSDKNGDFRNSFSDGSYHILSKDPARRFYHRLGYIVFFVLLGFMRLVRHFSSLCNSDPCMAVSGILGCLPSSLECFAVVVFFFLLIPMNGVDYGFYLAAGAFQFIWQRHYYILTKGELTKEYVVEDLHGERYTPPKLTPEHKKFLRSHELL